MSQTSTPTTPRPRPLSPHLGIYRWEIPMLTSILHRASGVLLSGGLMVVALWIYFAAYAPESFDWLNDIFTSLFGRVVIGFWALAFYYHLLNGIRHLCWDAGWGFTIPVAMKTGRAVLIGSVLLTAANLYCAYYL